jgi:glycosidase
MNTAALFHRPDSEFAYLLDNETMQIRLRTARGDIKKVSLIHGDPYQLHDHNWWQTPSKMVKWLSTDLYDYWMIEVVPPHKRLSYAFAIEGEDGMTAYFGDHGIYPLEEKYMLMDGNYFKMPFFHEVDRLKSPEWVKETVWYQIFPERFANGDKTNDPEGTLAWGSKEHPGKTDFYGGDLQGVIDHLDHLVELGVNGIYFCPIFKAQSNHKYDTIDYLDIDPDFGDKALFKKLVEECHARGIRVMLDAVFNHMGDDSPQFKDVLAKGEDSKYAKWFHINEFPVSYTETEFEYAANATYDTFAFTPHMPKLNTANPEVKEYLLHIAKYWIEEFDIDAWRLDVANEIDHQFWKAFYDACVNIKEDFYILGEIWHSSQSWLQGDEFHAVMNYAFTDSIISYFVKQEITMDKMVSELNNQLMLYRDQTNEVMFNVLDSHDTPRLLTVANDNKDLMKQVFAFTYIHQGVPCLYYGDEFGMDGGGDPDCRKCMIWDEKDQDLEMFAFMKNLIGFRREHQQTLTYGKLVWEEVDEDAGFVEFSRVCDDETITASFNTSEEAKSILVTNVILSHNAKVEGGVAEIEKDGFVITVNSL